jgi:DNA-binding response OmpR family regulator
MAHILLLSSIAIEKKDRDGGLGRALATILPSLSFLPHQIELAPADASILVNNPTCDLVAIDGRKDLGSAKSLTKLIAETSIDLPVLLISTESSLPALSASWGFSEIILDSASVSEVDGRIRILLERKSLKSNLNQSAEIKSGDVSIDEHTFTARIQGKALDLTYKEFELLKFLVQHPGRVFTRSQLLQEIWGYDYYGGTRTVDVHIRRLRSKLGPENESMIGTVRNVGYRFSTDPKDKLSDLVEVD